MQNKFDQITVILVMENLDYTDCNNFMQTNHSIKKYILNNFIYWKQNYVNHFERLMNRKTIINKNQYYEYYSELYKYTTQYNKFSYVIFDNANNFDGIWRSYGKVKIIDSQIIIYGESLYWIGDRKEKPIYFMYHLYVQYNNECICIPMDIKLQLMDIGFGNYVIETNYAKSHTNVIPEGKVLLKITARTIMFEIQLNKNYLINTWLTKRNHIDPTIGMS
ncbi:MAG: hypothetical protein Edafosvirus5_53 [Edafosvirus sp.]|uniref:Uncharacterized protein n=1 Tax=Edafosvirus sp. TaxID=2487765 RepID=A0A3G4ZTC0_9VIRU|nr:MAG: hypothetical protein Edafosvirus5_53 [Edafosvirus sp.]